MKSLKINFCPFSLLLAVQLIACSAYAQAPQGIAYQAVVRNAQGVVVASQSVGVRFSIRNVTSSGSVVYQETHSVSTNPQGLLNLTIGMGTAALGAFSGIDWSAGAKFLQVEIDPAGGNNYADFGTQQMMSVPYALYAGSTSTGTGAAPSTYRYGFSSSTSWTCPTGVTQITVELWGAGGTSTPGRTCTYNGMPNCSSSTKPGGKGGYNKQTLAVTPGTTYSLTVGLVGQGGQVSGFAANGGSSNFNGVFSAPGGTGAQFNGCNGDMCTPAVNGTDGAVLNYTYVQGPAVTIPSYIPSLGFLSNTAIPGCCAPADQNGFIVITYTK